MVAEQNNNRENSDSLRTGAASSAGKRTFSRCVYFKLSKKADFSSESCYELKLKSKLLFVQFVLNRLAQEHVYRLLTLVLEYNFCSISFS